MAVAALGAETWNWQEQLDSLELPGGLLVYNVMQPSLPYFPTDTCKRAAVSFVPVGLFVKNINTEGVEVAGSLNKKESRPLY